MISTILYYILKIIKIYLITLIPLAGIMASYQESKIWKSKQLPSLNVVGYTKVFGFNVVWMLLCFVASLLLLVQYIITFGQGNLSYMGNYIYENYIGKVVLQLFIGTVTIINPENLPTKDGTIPAPIYIANHASQLDIASVYYLNKQFKWIAKQSVLYLPGVGGIMYLGDHVLIQRYGKHGQSVSNLYNKSDAAVQSGIPMFLYPQGTRRIAELLPFKNGAFVIAQKNKSTIIPITITIPTEYNPWNTFYPINILWTGTKSIPTITLTVHKPIPVTGTEDINVLKEQCKNIIYSVLPPVYHNDTPSKKDK